MCGLFNRETVQTVREDLMHRIRLVAFAACLALVAAGAGAQSASAITARYTRFQGCPDRPEIDACVRSDTRAGHIKLGTTDVPISQTTTLSGGYTIPAGSDATIQYNSLGGLTGNALEVPGGLAGLTGISEIIINILTLGANRVYARAEAVGQPVLTFGTLDLRVGLRVRLINPFLVSGCAIGTTGTPIVLTLTTGTTAPPAPARPISGHGPTFFGLDPADSNMLLEGNVKHVDNSFAAPAANTCDLLGFGLITALVNSRVGLPSAGGRNEAVFDRSDIRLIDKTLVYP
jgi:hypothetical protein